MDEAEIWAVIARERASLAEVLEGLTEEQWATPSLCAGWTVRTVGAHVSLGSRMRLGRTLVEAVRARGDFNRLVDSTARRAAVRPTETLVTDLRTAAASRHLAPGQSLTNALLDILVHTQDITIPLGLDHPMPPEAAALAADDTWRRPFPFQARKRLHGLRLTATDTTWTAGEGDLVEGPISALLLLLTARQTALPALTGPGTTALPTRP